MHKYPSFLFLTLHPRLYVFSASCTLLPLPVILPWCALPSRPSHPVLIRHTSPSNPPLLNLLIHLPSICRLLLLPAVHYFHLSSLPLLYFLLLIFLMHSPSQSPFISPSQNFPFPFILYLCSFFFILLLLLLLLLLRISLASPL